MFYHRKPFHFPTTRKQLVANIRSADAFVREAEAIQRDANKELLYFDNTELDLKDAGNKLLAAIPAQDTSQSRYDLFNSLLKHLKRTKGDLCPVYRDGCKGGVSVKVDGKIPSKYRRAFARLADRVSLSTHYLHFTYTTTRYIFYVKTVHQKRAEKKMPKTLRQ